MSNETEEYRIKFECPECGADELGLTHRMNVTSELHGMKGAKGAIDALGTAFEADENSEDEEEFIHYFCLSCTQALPCENDQELFTWLYEHGMLTYITEVEVVGPAPATAAQ